MLLNNIDISNYTQDCDFQNGLNDKYHQCFNNNDILSNRDIKRKINRIKSVISHIFNYLQIPKSMQQV